MNKSNSYTIQVNTKCPEANREVQIYDLERIEGVGDKKNQLFKGFWMLLPIDIRFILDDTATTHWMARVFNDNTVMLSIQALNYSALYDRDQFEKRVSENALEAMDNAHHEVVDETGAIREERKWKHLYLEFDNDVKLSAKEINEFAGEEGKLDLQLIPVTASHPKNKAIKHTAMCAAWKVARLDQKARKKGKVEKKDNKSDAAKQLEDLINGVGGTKME